jgi:hypothetical protein
MVQTVFVGGFDPESDGQPEIDCLEARLKDMGMGRHETIYHKGDEFKGHLFVKFCNAETASKVVDSMGRKTEKHNNREIWSKIDAPVEVRVLRSVLLGLRWQLNDWRSLSKTSIRVDVPASTMAVSDVPVMSVHIASGKIQIKWLESTWAQWNELHDSAGFKALIDTGNQKLKKSSEEKQKHLVKGKGKSV